MNHQEKLFEDMSESFQQAFGYTLNKEYQRSIPLYEMAIQKDKNNFSAINNLAVAKIYLASERHDITLFEDAISDLKEAIRITKQVYKYLDGFPGAEGNLIWAEIELKKLK